MVQVDKIPQKPTIKTYFLLKNWKSMLFSVNKIIEVVYRISIRNCVGQPIPVGIGFEVL